METTKKVHSVKNVSGVAYGDTIKKGGGGGEMRGGKQGRKMSKMPHTYV